MIRILALALFVTPTLAATHTVCPEACDFQTLQAAVDAAQRRDTIRLDEGTYEGAVFDKGLTVEAMGPARPVIVSKGDSPDVLKVQPGAEVTLIGLDVVDGSARSGIRNRGTLHLDFVFILENHTEYGGLWNQGTLSMTRNTLFAGNSGSREGGGLTSTAGSVSIQHATFLANEGRRGGGIFIKKGSLAGSPWVWGNTAKHGGGLYNLEGEVSLQNADFAGNSAEKYGGGLRNYRGEVELVDCAFTDNHSEGFGGGWANWRVVSIWSVWSDAEPGFVTAVDVTYEGNTAGEVGTEDCFDPEGC